MSANVEITHTMADGTLVDGTARGDGTSAILKARGFRWSRSIGTGGAWYLPSSRDRAPRPEFLQAVADDLQAAGHAVTVQVDATPRSTAEVEADRAERASTRSERLAARAGRLGAAAVATGEQARAMADVIPLGQPIMAGHYSEGRDRNYRARVHAKMDKAVALHREAEETDRAARVAQAEQEAHLSAGATLRRIAKLEAEGRAVLRRRADRSPGTDLGRDDAELARLADELAYWRGHLTTLQADGAKLWGPADFQKGDRVNGSATVVRVNAKSLTVQHDVWAYACFTHPLPYDKVRSQERPAKEDHDHP